MAKNALEVKSGTIKLPPGASTSSGSSGELRMNSSGELERWNGAAWVAAAAGATDADGIVYDGTASGLTANDVQAAIDEVEARLDTVEGDYADDVEGPASSTDNAVARFDSTTGKLLQNSVVTVGDTGEVAGVTTLAASGVITSTVVTGTAPFTIASTTEVANLKAATATLATSATKSTNLTGGNSTTLLGSMPYQSDTDTTTQLAPNTTTTKKFLTQTGDATNGAAPGWNVIDAVDVPTLNQNTTGTASNVTGTVAIANGGTGQTTDTAAFDALSPMTTGGDLIYGGASGTGTRLANGNAGDVLTSAGTTLPPVWTAPAASPNQSYEITNLTLAGTVAANALTIAIKTQAGADPSAGSAVKIGFRSSTLSSGVYNQRTVTAALSTVISSGSTAGFSNGVEGTLYIYAIDNAGTVELAWSGILYDEAKLWSTTAEGGAGAADSNVTLYSTTARTSVPIRLIGRMRATEATAGTWATAPSEISLLPLVRQRAPTVQEFTTGSGTYTTPTGCTRLQIFLVGGGGGGGGSSTNAAGNGGAGGNGGNTTFGTSLLTAGFGYGGAAAGNGGGAGGGATISSPAVGIGFAGSVGGVGGQTPTGVYSAGAHGAPGRFGGAGSGGFAGGGSNAGNNTGGGGGGGGSPNTAALQLTGTGGGSGAYLEAWLYNPASSYAYAVGAGGSVGAAGTSGFAGGTGGTGYIRVMEYYD